MQPLRVIIAFLLGPLMAPLTMVALFMIAYVFSRAAPVLTMGRLVATAEDIVQRSIVEAYEATIFIGGPLYLLFRRMKWTSLAPSLIAGGVVALVPLMVGVDEFGRVSWIGLPGPPEDNVVPIILFVITGAATGLAFWLAAFAPLNWKVA